MADTLQVIAFPGASNWPLFAGFERKFFTERGIDLQVSLTPNSRHMARELHEGRAQIALTAIDNIIAYVEGHGEEVLEGPIDFFAFMGVDDGLLSVMTQPDVKSLAALRGTTLAVDAMTTGFAFVLRELLQQAGLRDGDVSYASVGTGAERLAALSAGACTATLLNAPLCLAAEAQGKARLLRVRDVLGSYQGVVGGARRSWAQANTRTLQAFIAGFHDSIGWLADPANKEAACAILAAKMPQLKASLGAAYDLLISQGGLTRSLDIDTEGVVRVIDLRRRYSTHADKPLGSPLAYIDNSFRQAALG
ncbi:ABC transporter substrate-binding protein [Bosea sp. BK604]|uniref:ABC transporter substrate-binding protein n=1 Tax=Bosea sp. BK604 TaxID=2512180 RepID=UPI0010455ADB|nr:ABC transporter substrate-binding protein [Bosea sp. BK604]TCR70463.1 ABC-type nitrate/sulfonate/bicarbonate transport system substrate-binding protein [Bosea sp. BK604]